MINKNKIIENIQKNIALSNFEREVNFNKNNKGYTHKKYWRIYEMKKIILAVGCCGMITIGGIAYAYGQRYLNLSSNFFKQENNSYLERMEENQSGEKNRKTKSIYLNGYLVVRPFEKNINDNSISKPGHNGIDIAAERGTKILAVADGIIKEISYNFQYGNYIIVKNDEEYETLYAHLDKVTVKEGESILHGDEIGTVGVTGNVTGPCLHFELHHNGEAINPLDYIDKIK